MARTVANPPDIRGASGLTGPVPIEPSARSQDSGIGSVCLEVGWEVDLQVGCFGGEPNLATRAERKLCYCRGCDVYQGGWLSLEVEPDPVCQQREAGDLRWPGVAGAAWLWALIADDHRGGADRDEHVTVLALGGDDEGTASDEGHVRAVGPAGVQVQADEFCDVAGGGLACYLRRGAVLDDAAGFEDDEPIRQHERFERVVGDQQARPGEVGQVSLELGFYVKAGGRAEGRQGFVKQQQRRLSGQRAGQRHPLRLPA